MGACDVFGQVGGNCETISFPENVNYDDLSLSVAATIFHNSLLTFFEVENDTATVIWNDVIAWQNDIIVWEANVINSELNDDEKEILLSASSVARYSITYWTYQQLNQVNWNVAVSCPICWPLIWKPLIIAVVEDVRTEEKWKDRQRNNENTGLGKNPSDATIGMFSAKESVTAFIRAF